MNHVMTVFEQIEPLISKLSDNERLELIRTIAMTPQSREMDLLQ